MLIGPIYACYLIDSYDWESLFDSDINVYWSRWLQVYLGIMEQAIPTAVLSPGKNLPWLTKAIKRAMNDRDKLLNKSHTVLNIAKQETK